jgi:hypothetical protein
LAALCLSNPTDVRRKFELIAVGKAEHETLMTIEPDDGPVHLALTEGLFFLVGIGNTGKKTLADEVSLDDRVGEVPVGEPVKDSSDHELSRRLTPAITSGQGEWTFAKGN